tara:strand:+ start:369 stop:566 length:198 start_codon:yes stop_codon:yes gene_type:complete
LWSLEPALASLLDVINRDRVNGFHTGLVVVIAQSHGPKLNPPFSPLGTGLTGLSHLTDELGAGKG